MNHSRIAISQDVIQFINLEQAALVGAIPKDEGWNDKVRAYSFDMPNGLYGDITIIMAFSRFKLFVIFDP